MKTTIRPYFCTTPGVAILTVILTVILTIIASDDAQAQFTMNSIGRNADTNMEIPVEPGAVQVDVLNESHAAVLRRKEWHERNNVDFMARLTGMVTQFNKSWTTNNQNSISSELAAYYYHIYSHDRYTSTFKFDGIYGMNRIDGGWFKNQDLLKIYYLTSWKVSNRRVLRNWSYSFESLFTSQFAEGFKSRTEKERWSNFLAPGTLTAGLGFTYRSPSPKLPFVVTINPVSGTGLVVWDDALSDARKMQLGIPAVYRENGRLVNYKIEGGSSLNVSFNRTFLMGESRRYSMQYISTLNSFYGWMTQVARHPTVGEVAHPAIRPTVRWDNTFIINPLKYLSLEFRTITVYDRSQVDKVQMQYYLRVGLTYRYKNR